jgi:hypothetical protein
VAATFGLTIALDNGIAPIGSINSQLFALLLLDLTRTID